MAILRSGGLAAICASAAMVLTALPAQADNAGVNIIYPPKQASDFGKPDEKAAPAVQKISISGELLFVADRPSFQFRRRLRVIRAVNRKLFQNYTGFRKVYSGRRYPF